MLYIGNVDPDRVDPVTNSMLDSADEEVKHAGGGTAAYAALQSGLVRHSSVAP